jgi:hypothetical protein
MNCVAIFGVKTTRGTPPPISSKRLAMSANRSRLEIIRLAYREALSDRH